MQHDMVGKTINGEPHTAFQGVCVFTKKVYTTAYIPTKQFLAGVKAYYGGVLIQNAMPFFNADDREFVISGISPHSNFFARSR